VWIPLAQPYGRFVTEMLTPQRYPEVKLPTGRDIVRPYDVAAWSLPLMMGVTVERGTLPDRLTAYAPAAAAPPLEGSAFALTPDGPEPAKVISAAVRAGKAWIARSSVTGERAWPAGTVFLDPAAARGAAGKIEPGVTWAPVGGVPKGVVPLAAPRVGVYRSWAASNDEGWTRFVLEQYGFEPKTLDNAAIRAATSPPPSTRSSCPTSRATSSPPGAPSVRTAICARPSRRAPNTRAAWRRKAPPRCASSSRRAAR
jgi:hypothetical protein